MQVEQLFCSSYQLASAGLTTVSTLCLCVCNEGIRMRSIVGFPRPL